MAAIKNGRFYPETGVLLIKICILLGRLREKWLKIVGEIVWFVIYSKIDRTYFEKESTYLMAKKKNRRRKRTFAEKVIMVLGVLIAISMVLSLFASFLSPGGF